MYASFGGPLPTLALAILPHPCTHLKGTSRPSSSSGGSSLPALFTLEFQNECTQLSTVDWGLQLDLMCTQLLSQGDVGLSAAPVHTCI